ncbi:MAG: alpha/beta fold hydrolase [Actinomycetota bacterium]
MQERTFVDAYGVDVSSHWWMIDAPRAVVLIAHGASEHGGRYDRFARALNVAGYAAVAIDHRGQGATSAVTGVGVLGPGGGEAVVADLVELGALARAEAGDAPLVLFGHSLGALIGLGYLAGHSGTVVAGVLCGFPIDPAGAAVMAELLRGAVDAGMGDAPMDALSANNEPFEPARTPFDWLSRDPDEVDAYLADPYCGDAHPLSYSYFAGIASVLAPAMESLGAIGCPVYVIAGDRDPAAGMGAHPTALADALGAAGVDATLRLYPDARHELLNETNRDEVTADLLAWIDARV